MDWLYKQLVENKQKAIVGFVGAAVFTWLAQHGFNVRDLTVGEVFDNLCYGILTAVGVYVKRNQK